MTTVCDHLSSPSPELQVSSMANTVLTYRLAGPVSQCLHQIWFCMGTICSCELQASVTSYLSRDAMLTQRSFYKNALIAEQGLCSAPYPDLSSRLSGFCVKAGQGSTRPVDWLLLGAVKCLDPEQGVHALHLHRKFLSAAGAL